MTGAVIDLAGLGALVEWTDSQAAADARSDTAGDRDAGRLDELREWLAATAHRNPPPVPARPRCVVVGPVSPRAESVAEQVGARVEPLVLPYEMGVSEALRAGADAADAQVELGTGLLVVAGPDTSVAAALLVGLLTDAEPVALLPRGARAVDTQRWIARAEHLRDLRREVANLRPRPDELLVALDHPPLAATAGLVLRAVARRTPVVLDGAGAAAAALLCHDVQSRAGRWWRFADRSPDPVHAKVVAELAQQPLLDLGTSAGDGTAGLLTLPLLRAAAEARAGGGS